MRFAVYVQHYVESEYIETRVRVRVTGVISLIATVHERKCQNYGFNDDVVDFLPDFIHVVADFFKLVVQCRYPSKRSTIAR